jgi:hypothetical protein
MECHEGGTTVLDHFAIVVRNCQVHFVVSHCPIFLLRDPDLGYQHLYLRNCRCHYIFL